MSDCNCAYCNKELDKKTAYHMRNSRNYFCNESCYINKEQDKKSPPKTKKDPKPIEGSDLRKLTDYIQKLYILNGIDKNRINWEMIIKQAKNIIANQEGNYNYLTLAYTLWYMVEVAQVNIYDYKEGSILNLVPYYIREANAYYNEIQSVSISARTVELDEQPIIVKINNTSRNKFKKITF